MSDTAQGPGWWLASDGKWYPPQPEVAPPPPLAPIPPTPIVLGAAAAPQGPGWWQASDGNWYPPQAASAPLPPPPAYIPNGEGSPAEGVTQKSRRGLVIGLGILLAIVVIGVVVAIAATKKDAPSAVVGTTAPAQSQADVASNAYISAFNTMNDVANAQTSAKNDGTDPSAQSAAWESEVTALQTFDTAVGQIDFPSADIADY